MSENADYHFVKLDPERLNRVNIREDSFKGFADVNESLNGFANKNIFPWNLIVSLNLSDMELGDHTKLENYRTKLEIKFNREDKPNVLFVANVRIGAVCDLIWRVHEPGVVDEVLKSEVEQKTFEFGYIMTHDVEWNEVGALIKL